jgi:hypothetical protein
LKYVSLDIHWDTISAVVLEESGKIVMQAILATHAGTVLDFVGGLRGSIHVTFEEGTHSAWLHDLLVRRVARVVVCDPRQNALLKAGNESDRIDAHKLLWNPPALAQKARTGHPQFWNGKEKWGVKGWATPPTRGIE